MNKKMVILSVLIVAMLLMLAGRAEENRALNSLMDAITWNSTPEEVESVLGDGVKRTEETDELIGTITMLQKDNSSFAGFKCRKMVFLYYNSNLYCIACYYTQADVGDANELIDGLTDIYGAPKMYESDQKSLDDLVSGTKTLCDWVIGDDTMISVKELNDAQSIFPEEEKSPNLCIVSFINTPIEKQLQEAMQAWASSSPSTTEAFVEYA